MKDLLTYLTLGLTSTGYAAWLNSAEGKQFADEFTWASVVTGSGLVLMFLRFLLPGPHWRKVVSAFIIVGVPLIVRSLINRDRRLFLE